MEGAMARLGGAPLVWRICPGAVSGSRIRTGAAPLCGRLNATTAEAAAAASSAPSDADNLLDCGVKWAQLALQGPRAEMEDDVQIDNFTIPGFTYAAVFDGHAGYSSVAFLKNELKNECEKALQGGAVLQAEDSSKVEDALCEAFLQADEQLISCSLAQAEDKSSDSGATATVLLLGSGKAVVAHVGDSRVVLARNGKAEVLTADHRPYGSSRVAAAEVKRIRDAGGWISNGRVCGYLSVSRAFGNISLKTRRQEMLKEGLESGRWTRKFVSNLDLSGDWLVARPDITVADLDGAEFVILASDGLWDSIKSVEAVKFVTAQLKEHGDAQRACEALAAAALSRNGQDNVSIIIADLGKITKQERFSRQQEDSTQPDFVVALQQVLITSGILLLGVYMTQLS